MLIQLYLFLTVQSFIAQTAVQPGDPNLYKVFIAQTAVQPGDPALAEFHYDVRASPPLRPGQGGGVCSPRRPHASRQCKHHGGYRIRAVSRMIS